MAPNTPLARSGKKPSLEERTSVCAEGLSGVNLATEPPTENSPQGFCPVLRVTAAHVLETPLDRVYGINFLTGCRKLNCPVCGPKKQYQLVRRIELGEPNRFMTLTARIDRTKTPREIFLAHTKKISSLLRWLRRDDPEFRHVRILESTKRGYPHFHFAIHSKWISQLNLSAKWKQLTGSSIVDIRRIRSNTARYVAKYLTKSTHVQYCRQRVSFSRNWPQLPAHELGFTLAEFQTIPHAELSDWIRFNLGEPNRVDIGNTIVLHASYDETSSIVEEVRHQFFPDWSPKK